MDTKTIKHYVSRIEKDEVIIELISLLNLPVHEVQEKHLKLAVEKKYKFDSCRYIIKYIPKTDSFDMRFSYFETAYDRKTQKTYHISQYNYWEQQLPVSTIRIMYPVDYYIFHNRYQKLFVIFK